MLALVFRNSYLIKLFLYIFPYSSKYFIGKTKSDFYITYYL